MLTLFSKQSKSGKANSNMATLHNILPPTQFVSLSNISNKWHNHLLIYRHSDSRDKSKMLHTKIVPMASFALPLAVSSFIINSCMHSVARSEEQIFVGYEKTGVAQKMVALSQSHLAVAYSHITLKHWLSKIEPGQCLDG